MALAEARTPEILRFGTFEVDLRSGELRKQGVRVKLQEQPFHVLTVLLQRRGEVVTREDLRSAIWQTDTFVDFDNGLNTSINKLREALGDSADNPRFIETLPRRGYRFISPVDGVDGATRGTPSGATAAARRSRKIGVMAAIAVLAAGIAAGLLWRVRHARHLTEKDTIVLGDFANSTGDPVFDDTLKQGLRVHLEQSPFLNILPDQKVGEELEMMGRHKDEGLTANVALEVCPRTGSKAILAGSISRLGAHYAIGLNALNCRTGDSLGSQQVEANSREQILKELGVAATKMRQKLGESLPSIQRYDAPLERATTTSLDALKSYSLGLSTVEAKGKKPSIPFFQRAVELDSNFAMAYARLGAMYSASDNPVLCVENVRRAYELRARVSERERLYIKAHYFRDVTGELDKAASVWEVMQQTYPREGEPYSNLSSFYRENGNYERALQEAHEAHRLYPDDQDGYVAVGQLYLYLNRLDDAEAVFREAEERKLESELLLWNRYQLAFLKGDEVEMERLVTNSAGKEGADKLRIWQGHVEAYHGRLRKARELIQPATRDCGRPCAQLSLIEAYYGVRYQAHLDADAAIKMSVKGNNSPELVLALALAGDAVKAKKLSMELDKNFPLHTRVQHYWLPTIRAAVALDRNNAPGAIELLHGIDPNEIGTLQVYSIYERGRAYLMLNNGGAAAAEFQKILDHLGIVGMRAIGVLAHLGMARAHALAGNTAKARAAYQDFLTLWKDADPDIPILIQAKAEYAKLR
jgi:DNA-binding winged helix-turn-helix (wHTH) protein/tetratricopeptide (TPR) repeat protein